MAKIMLITEASSGRRQRSSLQTAGMLWRQCVLLKRNSILSRRTT
jgi:hypothetical protein